MKYLTYFLSLLLWILTVATNFAQTPENNKIHEVSEQNGKDSISIWIKASQDKTLGDTQIKAYLDKAFKKAILENNDALQNTYFSKIAMSYLRINDSLSFRNVNKLSIALSSELKDSISLSNNYWDLGVFYSKYEVNDSAYFYYYQAQKIYEGLKKNYYSGRMLLNMAIVQADSKDYIGSEVTTIKAVELLKPLNNNKQLYRCYNNLGIIFNELKEYDKALVYHNKALSYQKKIETKNTFKPNTLNNIGVVFRNKKENENAINYFQLALQEENLKDNNIKTYAVLLDNLAYSRFKLKDTVGVKNLFITSLKIRDSIQDTSGVIVNKLHLAEFKATYKDTISALQWAAEAKDLAISSKNHKNTLAALLLLSKLDVAKGYTYANQYIQLNDSLLQQERVIRNKFARIRFETDEFIEQNEELNVQNELLSERNKIILLISGVLGFLSILLYIFIRQRLKTAKLEQEQEQQIANQEIYNLMLSQQNEVDEGRRKEKKRISQELHDGVLGRLLGARLVLETYNDKTDEAAILKREKYLDELQGIEEDIRDVSHKLHEKALDADIGYVQLIENLLEKQCAVSGFTYEFKSDKNISWINIKGDLKMNLYRIIQESIQNINKYSKAKHVKVLFRSEENVLYLTVRDNGVGFNTNAKSKGIGLKNINSRVKDLNGKVTIESKHNKGTVLFVEIPY